MASPVVGRLVYRWYQGELLGRAQTPKNPLPRTAGFSRAMKTRLSRAMVTYGVVCLVGF